MAKLSAGQKRRQKELKRRKKKQIQIKKRQPLMEPVWLASGLPKLSEQIIEFGEAVLDYPRADREFVEGSIAFLVMCWNIGSVSAERSEKLRTDMDQMLREQAGDLPDDVEDQIDVLITRRRFFYANDPRFVVEHNVSWLGEGEYHVQVMSILIPEAQRYHFSPEYAAAGLSDKSRASIAILEHPLTGQEQEVEELINKGWGLIKNHDTAERDSVRDPVIEAVDVWLEAWELIRTLYEDQTAIKDIDNRMRFLLDYWSAELDNYLLSAAQKDSTYIARGMAFCREFNQQFPDTHELTRLNLQRTGAELLLLAGEFEQGESALEALTRDFPDEAWSFIGWGDIYNPVYEMLPQVPVDIERAKRLYRIPIVRELDNAERAQDRLEELAYYQRQGSTLQDA
ncbi:hypothetical protein [Endozoicomonas sp. ONNA2]|uniref:hypothetical protein n=1 Tax=Endozoicomonas sp. ONNA2 TaxID=2828741 RepID=UPI0021497B66|nr:hypothetical protein [Endozoicomonas sp. ONNA2]